MHHANAPGFLIWTDSDINNLYYMGEVAYTIKDHLGLGIVMADFLL